MKLRFITILFIILYTNSFAKVKTINEQYETNNAIGLLGYGYYINKIEMAFYKDMDYIAKRNWNALDKNNSLTFRIDFTSFDNHIHETYDLFMLKCAETTISNKQTYFQLIESYGFSTNTNNNDVKGLIQLNIDKPTKTNHKIYNAKEVIQIVCERLNNKINKVCKN